MPATYPRSNDVGLKPYGGIKTAPSSSQNRDQEESDGSSAPPFFKEHGEDTYLEATPNEAKEGKIESTCSAQGLNQQNSAEIVNQKAGFRTTTNLSPPSPMDNTSSNPGKVEPQFNMAIHIRGDFMVRVCSLDTGSSVNLIPYRTFRELGLEMEPYDGPDLDPLGESFRPIGQVKFDWHVCRHRVTYNTSFVVAGKDVKNVVFDVLLGKDEIIRREFFLKNGAVWFLENANRVRLGPA